MPYTLDSCNLICGSKPLTTAGLNASRVAGLLTAFAIGGAVGAQVEVSKVMSKVEIVRAVPRPSTGRTLVTK